MRLKKSVIPEVTLKYVFSCMCQLVSNIARWPLNPHEASAMHPTQTQISGPGESTTL